MESRACNIKQPCNAAVVTKILNMKKKTETAISIGKNAASGSERKKQSKQLRAYHRQAAGSRQSVSESVKQPGISSKISYFSLEKSQRKLTKGSNFISRANGCEGVMGNSRRKAIKVL